ncbi:MAG: hypothetical protein QOI57_547, partial [Rubrobacteraceae bacterium]|nr:hypothetical protein [Rubrobacteraceae bacterium]
MPPVLQYTQTRSLTLPNLLRKQEKAWMSCNSPLP